MSEFEFMELPKLFSSISPIDYQYFNNLLNKRTIILNDEINESFFECVVLPLLDFEQDDSNKLVRLYLNTPGGSVADGLTLCNIIDNYKKPLEIVVPSYACSMGTIILCSGNDNSNVIKKAYPSTFALFHSGQTYVGGESTSVEDVMNFNKSVDEKIKQYIITHTKITEEEYMAHHRKQWYLTADEMLSYGLIDEIIGR